MHTGLIPSRAAASPGCTFQLLLGQNPGYKPCSGILFCLPSLCSTADFFPPFPPTLALFLLLLGVCHCRFKTLFQRCHRVPWGWAQPCSGWILLALTVTSWGQAWSLLSEATPAGPLPQLWHLWGKSHDEVVKYWCRLPRGSEYVPLEVTPTHLGKALSDLASTHSSLWDECQILPTQVIPWFYKTVGITSRLSKCLKDTKIQRPSRKCLLALLGTALPFKINKYYHRVCEQRQQAAMGRAGEEPCSKQREMEDEGANWRRVFKQKYPKLWSREFHQQGTCWFLISNTVQKVTHARNCICSPWPGVSARSWLSPGAIVTLRPQTKSCLHMQACLGCSWKTPGAKFSSCFSLLAG